MPFSDKKTAKEYAKRYKKTRKGLLVYCYNNMRRRCTGLNPRTRHIYFGVKFPDKEAFYRWAIDHAEFNRLHKEWAESGFKRRDTPSIDRIDSTGDYSFENMQWITCRENSIKSNKTRYALSDDEKQAVARYYRECGSLKRTSQKFSIGWETAKRIAISCGLGIQERSARP